MPSSRNINYAKREIELAKQALSLDPQNILQQERLSCWSAYLGDFETAEQYAATEKAKVYLEQCKTS